MAHIIDFSIYLKKEEMQQTENKPPSEELKMAIQTLIEQLRKEPLQQIS